MGRVGGDEFLATERDLPSFKNALNKRADSKGYSKEREPKRVISDWVLKAPVPKSFSQWAIWVFVMLSCCAGEATLITFLIDGDGNSFRALHDAERHNRQQNKGRE